MSVCVRTLSGREYVLDNVQPQLSFRDELTDDELMETLVELRDAAGNGFPSIPLAAFERNIVGGVNIPGPASFVNLRYVEAVW